MIFKKDDGKDNSFWAAATGDRVILPNGEKPKRSTYEPTGWYLLSTDEEYWLYPVEEIERITYTPGSILRAYPVGEPYAIYDNSKYDYDFRDNAIVITEISDGVSHPPYYAEGWSDGAEVIDLTEHLSFCAGNVVKYVCRAGRKDPKKHIEDLEKAQWYLNREIERIKEH